MKTYKIFTVALNLVFVLLLVLVFPPQTSKELHLIPQWTYPSTEINTSKETNNLNEAYPVLFQDELAYLNQEGRITHSEDREYHFSFTTENFVNTSQEHRIFAIKNHFGSIVRTVESDWFPLLFDSFMVSQSPDGLSLKVENWKTSEPILERSWASLIVDVDFVEIEDRWYLAVGLLDGRIYLFSGESSVDISDIEINTDPESESLLLFNLDLSINPKEDEIQLRTVSGTPKSYLQTYLLEKDSALPSLIGQKRIPIEIQSTVLLSFIPNNQVTVIGHDRDIFITSENDSFPDQSFRKSTPLVSVWGYLDNVIFTYSDDFISALEIYDSAMRLLFSREASAESFVFANGLVFQRNSQILAVYQLVSK